LAELLPGRDGCEITDGGADAIAMIQAVICCSVAGPVGLVVGTIEDIVPEPAAVSQPSSRPGVSGALIHDERVIEVLDVDALIAAAFVGASS
jgi:hypothetical protein